MPIKNLKNKIKIYKMGKLKTRVRKMVISAVVLCMIFIIGTESVSAFIPAIETKVEIYCPVFDKESCWKAVTPWDPNPECESVIDTGEYACYFSKIRAFGTYYTIEFPFYKPKESKQPTGYYCYGWAWGKNHHGIEVDVETGAERVDGISCKL